MNVLLVYSHANENVGTIKDHVEAICNHAGDYVQKIDHQKLALVPLFFFDCIIFHYSVIMCSENFVNAKQRKRMSAFKGFKVAYIQDEYRFIDQTAKAIHDLGISYVFTLVADNTVNQVYHHDFLKGVTFENTLTGYVPAGWASRDTLPYLERPVDVSYRARKLVSWLGKHTLQKWQIADRFIEDINAREEQLVLDVSVREEDRVYGEKWEKMMFKSKAVLAVESGASVCDFDGSIEQRVNEHLERYPNASFEELSEAYFKEVDGIITQKVISPRCFEAAAARTLMIMYPGFFNGILKAGRHYVELKEDHSNLDEVLDILKDDQKASQIINHAYEEIALCEKYQQDSFARRLKVVLRDNVDSKIEHSGISITRRLKIIIGKQIILLNTFLFEVCLRIYILSMLLLKRINSRIYLGFQYLYLAFRHPDKVIKRFHKLILKE